MVFFLCFVLLTIDHLLLTNAVHAFDRTNVPLKNWGGFSIQRSWVYDALEKIVLAGLTDKAILNTKPLSRVEAARIVGQAVERLKQDQYGDYNHRGYLEELVYQLVQEFGPELAEMGIRTPLNREANPGFFEFNSIEHLQFGTDFATSKQSVINDFGRRLRKGANFDSTADGRLHVGDYLSLYYQPEFSLDKDSYEGRLLSGYGKFTLWNTELVVGRESLWLGPGFRGSMTFSNNAEPLNQIRLSSAEPFQLPWLLRYLGPTKLSAFVVQLENNRDFPHAKVGGWRINFAPSRYVELGFSRVFQFGGDGRATVKPWQYLALLFSQGSDDPKSALNVNNLMSLDATVRWPDARRYIYIARDLSLYGELGWDDTQDPGFQFLFLPTGAIIPRKPGGIAGVLLTGFLDDPKLDLRLEYAKTTNIQFNHFTYTSGFTYRGAPLSHFIGTDGDDLYARVTRWMSPDLLLGFQVSRSHIGSPEPGIPVVQRQSAGLDISYRFSPSSSIFLGYDYARSNRENRNESDFLFRFQFTHSFGK